MSRTLTRTLIAIGAVLVLGSVNYSIYAKEQIKNHGDVIYLQLAPVDPRSLMQGDYMALRFSIASVFPYLSSRDQRMPLQVDERRVATLGGSDATLRLRYRVRNGRIWIGTNAYFFEEGTADRYVGARFGKFRIDPRSGEAVLVGLADEQLQDLGR
jgi:uncharacterized membrane-anchored protein